MYDFLKELGIKDVNYGATLGTNDSWMKTKGKELVSYSPIDGKAIATVIQATEEDYETIIVESQKALKKWRIMPAPQRGEVIRRMGLELRKYKDPLGKLVTLEMGKIYTEGLGEVQEMIDMADFAVGLSRQLYGLTMHSERPNHRMYEQWHPLGIVGVVTSFNFPVAVWAWNSFVAGVCGDAIVWKPSSKTPLTAIATQNIVAPIIEEFGLKGIFSMFIGAGRTVGNMMVEDRRVPLISATGSCDMGRDIGQKVAKRLGKTLLELGGNNAIIVREDADIEMAMRATLFGAVGTAGQRCTSTRRIIIQKSVKEKFLKKLIAAYKMVRIGDPLDANILMGPLVGQGAVDDMFKTIKLAKEQGAKLLIGGETTTVKGLENGFYVLPTIFEAPKDLPVMQDETFAPVLYIIEYDKFEEAIEIHNGVDQGLSSSIFTASMHDSERFLSHEGSDCGIANVNIGTSGAEIGGAFGGEKDTGGGRESGSDAWKIYMRRQTNTINWGKELPLAQGVEFDID